MTKRPSLLPPGFDELSPNEKVEYVQSLWDRIAADESQVPVPEWHKAVLRERLQSLNANPSSSVSENDAYEQMRKRLQKKGTSQ